MACACLAVNENIEKMLVKKGWENSELARNDVMKTFNCCGLFDNDSDQNSNLKCNDLNVIYYNLNVLCICFPPVINLLLMITLTFAS